MTDFISLTSETGFHPNLIKPCGNDNKCKDCQFYDYYTQQGSLFYFIYQY